MNKPTKPTVSTSQKPYQEDPSKPFGRPVEGCSVCEALYKGDIKSINSQPHESVLKHVTENHLCRPPSCINGRYYLEHYFITVVIANFRRGKYIKRYLTIQAFWEKEFNKFKVWYDDEIGKSALISPEHVEIVRVFMDED